ncbi:hypothetical protein [Klebsiella quasivariicola]|uniref:hypothetical protein n=1 Tax=Klebsiella quasivariicola TaxID=2026240 RepID=UPI00247AA62F|nr:hypothetical protein [Klebsiella quasivariicola]
MQQLSVFEMEAVSGGTYTWDFSSVTSAITTLATNGISCVAGALGAGAIGAMIGSIIGGRWGGAGGGILGIGSIGQGVGMVWGLVVGAIGGAICGALVGFDDVYKYGTMAAEGGIDGTLNLWS